MLGVVREKYDLPSPDLSITFVQVHYQETLFTMSVCHVEECFKCVGPSVLTARNIRSGHCSSNLCVLEAKESFV